MEVGLYYSLRIRAKLVLPVLLENRVMLGARAISEHREILETRVLEDIKED